jgi:hypothetical protein
VLDGRWEDNSSDDVKIRTTLECVTQGGQMTDMGRVEGARIYQYPIDSVLAEKGYPAIVTARSESCLAAIVLVNAVAGWRPMKPPARPEATLLHRCSE